LIHSNGANCSAAEASEADVLVKTSNRRRTTDAYTPRLLANNYKSIGSVSEVCCMRMHMFADLDPQQCGLICEKSATKLSVG